MKLRLTPPASCMMTPAESWCVRSRHNSELNLDKLRNYR
jgi:hypothetical protein